MDHDNRFTVRRCGWLDWGVFAGTGTLPVLHQSSKRMAAEAAAALQTAFNDGWFLGERAALSPTASKEGGV